MFFSNLEEWLNWQNSLHPHKIDLGLTRCRTVAQRLNLLSPSFPIISVAGTNGKGSSVMLLDAILSSAGYRVGRFMSPHLLRYNERICIAGCESSDAEICRAFELIEEIRDDISLTFFEFSTLAALLVFQHNNIDFAVLEVGLGGRLDAVNIFDPDIALVTAIDIDHVEWLGKDRESIGFEKAGIFRAQHPAVCSDPQAPQSLIDHAHQLHLPLYCLERDFFYEKQSDTSWSWQDKKTALSHLPILQGDFQQQNAAGVLMVLKLLNIPESAIRQGLVNVRFPGRFQILPGRVTCILDVAHNPLGAQVLSQSLRQYPCQGETHAVLGMCKDKDIAGVLSAMHNITHWHIAPLNTPRSATISCLLEHLTDIGSQISTYSSITKAYQSVLNVANEKDRIIVFGSFYTVSEVLQNVRNIT